MADFDEVKREMMFGIYELARESDTSTDFSGREISGLLKDAPGRAIADQACKELMDEKFLSRSRYGYDENNVGDTYYRITPKLIRAAEEFASINHAPASDRIVTIDHNSHEYKRTVKAVDDVIDAVAGDNEYGDSAPEEKEVIVTTLKAGRQLLDGDKVKESVLRATLISVLQYIADIFAKTAIKKLAATAVAKLLGLF